MADVGQDKKPEQKQEVGKLWREERYTDSGFANIAVLVPVLDDGNADDERKPQYFGRTQVSFGLPRPTTVMFELKADSLASAKELYLSNLQPAIERAHAEVLEQLKQQQQQREASRKIIEVPGGAMPPPLL